jgi:hypothetical protein
MTDLTAASAEAPAAADSSHVTVHSEGLSVQEVDRQSGIGCSQGPAAAQYFPRRTDLSPFFASAARPNLAALESTPEKNSGI